MIMFINLWRVIQSRSFEPVVIMRLMLSLVY